MSQEHIICRKMSKIGQAVTNLKLVSLQSEHQAHRHVPLCPGHWLENCVMLSLNHRTALVAIPSSSASCVHPEGYNSRRLTQLGDWEAQKELNRAQVHFVIK